MKKNLNSNDTLQVTISPETVYISTNPDQSSYANIAVTVKNSGVESVSVNTITITLPAALAPAISLGGITPVASASEIWDFVPSMINTGEFDATTVSGNNVDLNPDESWLFTLQMVTLVNPVTAPVAAVPVSVIFGDNTVYSASPTINIAPAVAAITFFNAKKSDINPGEAATLTWQCEEIDYCIISPIDTTHRHPTDTLQVSPPSTTNYTLYAYAPGIILSAQWGISVENPQILKFGGKDGQTSVNYGDNITLVWSCNQFTESISITDNKDVYIPDYTSGSNTPQQGSITVGPITEPTTFTLNAYGNSVQNFDQRTPTININDFSCTFTASPDIGIWQQDKVTLTWDIQSASFVSISPVLANGPSLQNLSGSVDVYPVADVNYIITVSGFIGNSPKTIPFNLPLTVTPVQLTGFTISPVQIIPAAGGSNSAVLNWTAQAQVLSIDNGVGDVTNETSYALTAPTDQTVYILSAGTLQNPVLSMLTVTVQNGYGPFNGTIIPADTLNIPIPPSPYSAYLQADLDYTAVFVFPLAYANLMPLTYYILEIDGVSGDSAVDYINSVDPVLGAQLTPGRYLGYADVYQNTIYGQSVVIPFFAIVIKFDTVAQYPATIKIITVTPALT